MSSRHLERWRSRNSNRPGSLLMADRGFQVRRGDEIATEKNRYVVIQRLREGGNSVPLVAFCINGPLAGVPCVVKVFDNIDKPLRLQHFIAEGELLARLSHPSVIKVLDQGTISESYRGGEVDYAFHVTPLYKVTLLQRLRERMTLVERVIVAIQLLSAIRYLSSLSDAIIHRDIKPANILLEERSCVLADFGLFITQSHLDSRRSDATFRSAVGSDMPADYLIPDLLYYAATGADVSPAANVFQLGLVLCELFTGSKPGLKGPQRILDVAGLPNIAGIHGDELRSVLQAMLHTAAATRASVDDALTILIRIGERLCIQNIELNGRIF